VIQASWFQASWLGPNVGGHLALCCIHHVNQVNSRDGSAMMTALKKLSLVLLFTQQDIT